MFKSMAFKHFVVKMQIFNFNSFFKNHQYFLKFNFEKEEWCILMMEWLEQGIWRHKQDNAQLHGVGTMANCTALRALDLP